VTPAAGSPAVAAPKVPIVGSAGCTSQGAPIDVGQVGSFSGLVGASVGGFKTGVSLWAKAVNAAGGVGCRPIRLFQADDQSSPSVAQSVIQDLVQNKHVSALIGTASVLNMPAIQAAVNKFKVPAIGSAGPEPQFNYSPDPLMFNQGGSGVPSYVGASLAAAEVAGGKNVGILYCVEAQLCTDLNNGLGGKDGLFAKYGMNPVFAQSISLTQSSFTSACQNAKNAKVDVIFLAMDSSSVQRTLRDCLGINYHPQYSASSISTSAAVSVDPNVRKAGVFTGAANVPFLANPNAASAAFHDAVSRYLGSAQIDQAVMAGWASGQMYAAAIHALAPTVRAGAITPDVVLKGLWSLKDEDLDGLSPPLNFPQGKPYPVVTCYYVLRIGAEGYTAENNGKQKCL
jgi:branched-chain amino acid transport system substrate-binding protein